MNLRSWLDQNNVTAAEFGRRVELSRSAVLRIAMGKRMPRPDAMRRIVEATAGAVQPNDFFESANASAPSAGEAA